MNSSFCFMSLIIALSSQTAHAADKIDALCEPLQKFASGIPPSETHELVFHTVWGGNFKNSPEQAFFAMHCVDSDYLPAKAVCKYLVEHGAVEFAGVNATRVIECLSSETHLSSQVNLSEVKVSFAYGTEDRGSIIEVEFGEDAHIGGMALRLSARGY